MNKKLIVKEMFVGDEIAKIDDDQLTAEWKKKTIEANTKLIRMSYGGLVMYFPVSEDTYRGKTDGELFAKFIKSFVKTYNSQKGSFNNEKSDA